MNILNAKWYIELNYCFEEKCKKNPRRIMWCFMDPKLGEMLVISEWYIMQWNHLCISVE
jgi:hypothetical protein